MDENNSKYQDPANIPAQIDGSEDKNSFQDTTSNRRSTLIAEVKRQKAGASENFADNENQAKKIPFPKGIFFIVCNEFCERFNYYGTRLILLRYFVDKLDYSFDSANAVLRGLGACGVFFCVFGAIIADSWFGKFRTVLLISVGNIFGSVIIALGAIPYFKQAAGLLTLVGYTLIALSSSTSSPCVAAFGGDQFVLPEQAEQMAWYFFMFFFNYHAGLITSLSIVPILRDEVTCFGEKDCQSLALGLPAFLRLVGLVVFIIGRPFYTIISPPGNVFVLVTKAIYAAVKKRYKERKTSPRQHLLDYVKESYNPQLISDIKAFGRILLIFLPFPIIWGFLIEVIEKWILQTDSMDGLLGSWLVHSYDIRIMNPLLILAFLPLRQFVVHPALKYVGIKTPIQRIIFGGMLASVAFILSAILELFLEETYPVLPKAGKAQLRIFNGEPCDYTFQTNIPGKETFEIKAFDYFEFNEISVENDEFQFDYGIQAKSRECTRFSPDTYWMKDNTAYSLFMASNSPNQKLIWYEDFVASQSQPLVRTLANIQDGRIVIWKAAGRNTIESKEEAYENMLNTYSFGRYKIFIDQTEIFEADLKIGGVYTFVIYETLQHGYIVKSFEITKPNSINILWILPQFIVITIAQTIITVSSLEFSYTQAPLSMKSLVMAGLFWTVQLGIVIIDIIDGSNMLNSMSVGFFLFGTLMFVDMLILIVLASFYKRNNPIQDVER